jgi:uncharacterized membrane protein YeaQ/YmgE (transglycosylase-associated protein family)
MGETILWLVLGVVAGVLALFAVERRMPSDPMGWIGALVIGLIGGWVGGWLAGLVGLEAVSWLGSLVIAFLGAALIIWLMRRATGRQV